MTTSKLPSEHYLEIARLPRPLGLPLPAADRAQRVNRHVLRSEGFMESLASSSGQGVYSLFEEMEEKDAHLYSLLQTRKFGLLARPRTMQSASASRSDLANARWIESVLESLEGWEAALLHLLGALSQGIAILEVLWDYDAKGRVIPVQLKPRGAWRFNFGPDGALHLNDPSPASISSFTIPNSPFSPGRLMPDRKFIVMRFDATDERPYGRGLLERVYWYWWFKKNNIKFWLLYNEKFGAPTVIAKHGAGLSQPERDRLLEVISSLQADAGVTVPEEITLELLESNRRGSAETYRDLALWCNDEMSRAVLGQTLTTSEGSRSGSLALARVHEGVRFDYIRTDASLLMNAINSQLIRWMMDFNFGEQVPSPRWTIDLNPDLDAELEVKIDRQLLQMGVPLPLRYFLEKYRRPASAPGERQLRYDDNNLFQYHLQFGVLTVNEVRAALGLPPVAWGDEPTSPAAPRSPGTTGAPPTPRSAAGDDPEEPDEAELKREQREEK